MNAEDFLRKHLKIELEKEFQGGADLSVINQVIEDCIVEYRRRSCFKPNVWDFLFARAKRLCKKLNKHQK